jgi:hypothetical protein
MPAKADNLMAAIVDLERVLDGTAADERGRTTDLDRALAGLEEAVRRHADALRGPEGLVGNVDRPRIPSPAVDRHTERLRQVLAQILRHIQGLRVKARAEGQDPAVSGDPATLAGALPVAPEAAALADHGVLVQRARQLARALERFENEEADLMLDSVNMDIGAGD